MARDPCLHWQLHPSAPLIFGRLPTLVFKKHLVAMAPALASNLNIVVSLVANVEAHFNRLAINTSRICDHQLHRNPEALCFWSEFESLVCPLREWKLHRVMLSLFGKIMGRALPFEVFQGRALCQPVR